MERRMDTQNSIAELLFMRVVGMEDSDEKQRLDQIIEQNPEFGKLKDELCDYANYKRRQQKLAGLNAEKELRRIMAPARRGSFRRAAMRIAVAVVPLMMIGAAVYLLTRTQNTKDTISESIAPPRSGAVLRLSDGTDLELTDSGQTAINDNGTQIAVKDRMLDYQNATKGEGAEISGNRLIVGRNRVYKVALNDGTLVWLNSESELRYPAVFGGGERLVSVTGEAYFEVAEDKERPFVVALDDGSRIRVLGTKFNVRAYPDDPATETSLLQGRVAIHTAVGQIVLEPSQQAVIHPDGRYDIRHIDPSYAAAWTQGWFCFENKPLGEVLAMIGRWYDVDFRFANEEFKHIFIAGKLRQLDLDTILDMIGTTAGVRFDVAGRQILVCGT